MRLLLLLTLLTLLSCKSKISDWETYNDRFNISSISFPTAPNERLDTMTTPNFSLVNYTVMSGLENMEKSPSAFTKQVIYPTNIAEFDMYAMKKDSSKLNSLFNSMINNAVVQSNGKLLSKVLFSYPEPSVKFIILDSINNMRAISRIIIFDNFVVNTTATGKSDIFDEEIEEEYFNTLKVDPDKSKRR